MYHYVNPSNTRRHRRQVQALSAVCILLVIACVSLVIAFSRTSSSSNLTGEMLVAKMQTEASNALSCANSLSMTNGSTSSALIAATRQHVYAMEVLNELTSGIYGAGHVLIDPKLLDSCIIAHGSVNAADINIRLIMQRALLFNASVVVLAHNHPSGLADPSPADISTTLQIYRALSLAEIHLWDHIIVGDNDVTSMRAIPSCTHIFS